MRILKNISLFVLVVFISVFGFSGIGLANSSEGQYASVIDTLLVKKTINSEQAVKLKAYYAQKEIERNAARKKLIDEIMVFGYVTADQAEAVFSAMYKDEDCVIPESIDNVLNALIDKKIISPSQSIKLYGYFSDKAIELKGNMIEELSSNTDLSVDEAEIVWKTIHWSASGPKNANDLASLVNNGTLIEDDIDDVMSYFRGRKYDQNQIAINELVTAAGLSKSQAKAVLKAF